jgi:tetratricopeptide (TPR) repeat protein
MTTESFTTSTWRWAFSGHWQLRYYGLPPRFPWPAHQPDPVFSPGEEFPILSVYHGVEAYLKELADDEIDRRFASFARHLALGGDLVEALDREDYRAAETTLAEMRKGGLNTAYLLHNRSHVLEKSGRAEEALTAIRLATRLCPESEMLWFAYAGVCQEAGDFPEAIRAWKECLRLVPGHPEALGAIEQLDRLAVADARPL